MTQCIARLKFSVLTRFSTSAGYLLSPLSCITSSLISHEKYLYSSFLSHILLQLMKGTALRHMSREKMSQELRLSYFSSGKRSSN